MGNNKNISAHSPLSDKESNISTLINLDQSNENDVVDFEEMDESKL